MTDPTPVEIVRRLDDVTQRLDRVSDRLEQGYVRKDLYDANRTADRDDVKDVIKRLDVADAFRKQIIAGCAVGVILLAVNLAIALSNFMARG